MQSSSRQMAKNFLQDQINIMKKYGKGPKLNSTQTKKLVADIQASFESLGGSKEPKSRKTQVTA